MTETTIDEILSLLRDQKQEYEDIAIDIKRQTLELKKRLHYIEGNLNQIDYLIKYIEEDDHITDASMKTIMDDTGGIRGTDYHRYRDGRDALPS